MIYDALASFTNIPSVKLTLII